MTDDDIAHPLGKAPHTNPLIKVRGSEWYRLSKENTELRAENAELISRNASLEWEISELKRRGEH